MKKRQVYKSKRNIKFIELEPRIVFDAAIPAAIDAIDNADAPDTSSTKQLDSHDVTDQIADTSLFLDKEIDVANPNARNELVIVDSKVTDIDLLKENLKPNQQLVWLQDNENGIETVKQALQLMGEVDALHLVTLASDEGFTLGLDVVSEQSINELSSWRPYLTETADILLYGGDVSSLSDSSSLYSSLAYMTGADVAASNVGQDDIETLPLAYTIKDEKIVNASQKADDVLLDEAVLGEPSGETVSVIVVDSRVEGIDELRAAAPADAIFAVIDGDDGLSQLTSLLENYQNISDVQLFSHGDDGVLYLGNDTINQSALEAASGALSALSNNFTGDADFLIYGCDVAQTDVGQQFVQTLSALTGTDVAASNDATGSAANADWILEATTGDIETLNPYGAAELVHVGVLNTAPTVTRGSNTVNGTEDTPLTFTGGNAITIGDVDNDTLTVTLSVNSGTLSLASTSGLSNIVNNGTTISFESNAANATAALAGLTYTGDLNFNGNDTLSVSVNDGSDTTSRNVTLAIAASNDVPTVQNSAVTVSEASSGTITTILNSSHLSATDIETTNPANITYTIETLPNDAELRINGTLAVAGDSFTQADINSGKVSYVNIGGEQASDSFTYTVSDPDGGQLTGQTFNITVNTVNDALVEDAVEIAKLNEGGTFALTDTLLNYTDVDTALVNIVYTITAENLTEGTLFLNGVALSVSDSFTQADINAGLVTFTHNGQEPVSSQSFDFSVTDGTTVLTNTFTIQVTPENDVPQVVINAISVNEGDTITFDANDFSSVDPDNVDQQIIYKLKSLPTNGTLLFNNNPVAIDTIFSQNQIGLLKYIHNGSETTSDSFSLTVNDGAGGQVAETTIPLTIVPVNDPVSVGGTNTTVYEGQSTTFNLNISDNDNADTDMVITINSLPADGTFTFNGSAVQTGDSFTVAEFGQIIYTHDGNDGIGGNPIADTSFDFTLTDNTGSIINETMNIDVQPVNDDPLVNTNQGVTVDEGSAATISFTELSATDNDDPDQTITYQIETIPEHGRVVLNGQALGVGAIFTQKDIDDGLLSYKHDGSNTTADQFTFTIRDGGFNVITGLESTERDSGGTQVEHILNIVVNPVEDGGVSGDGTGGDGLNNVNLLTNTAPSVTLNNGFLIADSDQATEGGVGKVITAGDLVITDAEQDASKIRITITSLPEHGVLKLNGATLSPYQSFTYQDVIDGNVTYDHNGTENFRDSFDFNASDGSSLNTSDSFDIEIEPVNDRPQEQSGTQNVKEDSTTAIDKSKLKLSDSDGSSEIGLSPDNVTFTINTLPQHGTLTLNGSPIVQGVTQITQADIDDGKLVYIHDGSENATDSFDFIVDDNTGESNATRSGTFDLRIIPVNDDPVVSTNETLTVYEGGNGDITTAFLASTDPDSTTVQQQFRITNDVDNGSLFLNGKALGGGSVFTQADIESGALTYVHDGSETTSDSFDFRLEDGGGGFETATFNINVLAINDVPEVNAPTNINVFEDQPFNITNVNIDDVDAGAGDVLTVTLTSTNGNLSLTNISSTTEVGANIVLTGTKAQINAALSTLKYTGNANVNGTATISLVVNDNGNTGVDPSDSNITGVTGLVDTGTATTEEASTTINVTIQAVNDPIEVSTPTAQSLDEDTTLTFSNGNGNEITFADADENGDNTITLNVNHGVLNLAGTAGLTSVSGDGTATVTLVGSLADIQAALDGLVYSPSANYNGSDSLQISITDTQNGAGGAQTTNKTIAITVNPVNDPVSITGPSAAQTTPEDVALTFNNGNSNRIQISDIDGNLSVTVTLSLDNVSDGTLTLNSTSGLTFLNGTGNGQSTITVSGTVNRINSALNGMKMQGLTNQGGYSTNLTIDVDDNQNGGSGSNFTDQHVIAITVPTVNDAPTISAPSGPVLTNAVTNEITFSTANSNAITVGDVDADPSDLLKVTISATGGEFTLSGVTGLTFTVGDGTDDQTMTFTGTIADINAALEGMVFDAGVGDLDQSFDATITVNDQGNNGTDPSVFNLPATGDATSEEATTSFEIRSSDVNDAPIITKPADQSTSEDVAITFSGTNVISFSDEDAFGEDVTVTLSVSSGVLDLSGTSGLSSVSGNGTGSIVITGSLSELNAAVDGLEYTPDANYFGPDSLTITIDDLGNTGSGGAKSDTEVIAITINAVPDAPVASNLSTSGDEDVTSISVPALSAVDNIDTGTGPGDSNTITSYTVTSLPSVSQGALFYADGITQVSTSTSLTPAEAAGLIFVPAENFNDNVTFSYIATDGDNVNSNTATVTITINPINDAPVITNLDGSFGHTEDGGATVIDANVSLTDPELDASDNWNGATLEIVRQGAANDDDVFAASGTLSALTEGGNLSVGGTVIGTVTSNSNGRLLLSFNGNATSALVNQALQQVTYAIDNDNPPTSVVLDVTVNDGNSGAQGSGGALTSTQSITVNITPTNDAPTTSSVSRTIAEDNNYSFALSDFSFADVDSSDTAPTAVRINTLPAAANGQLLLNGVAVTAGQVVSAADIANLVFDPAADLSGNGIGNFTFSVQDDLGGFSTSTNFTINVTPVTDTPILNAPSSLNVDGISRSVALNLSTSLADVDGSETFIGGSNGVYTISGLANGIVITQGGVPVTVTNGVATLPINGGAIQLSFNSNFAQASTSFTMSVTAQDGAAATVTQTRTVTANIAPVLPVLPNPGSGPLPPTGGPTSEEGTTTSSVTFRGVNNSPFSTIDINPIDISLTQLYIAGSIDTKLVLENRPALIEVSKNIFRHLNPNEPLSYEAKTIDGAALPEWMNFEEEELRFTGIPPNGSHGTVELVITARDTDGNQVDSAFKVVVNRDLAELEKNLFIEALPNIMPAAGDGSGEMSLDSGVDVSVELPEGYKIPSIYRNLNDETENNANDNDANNNDEGASFDDGSVPTNEMSYLSSKEGFQSFAEQLKNFKSDWQMEKEALEAKFNLVNNG